ncbi:MAG: patatin [Bacteroidetes bacterium SW_9_63_38]|nr:MAG: patatin [Bacteroidetes bacterium SW_9_63_38]
MSTSQMHTNGSSGRSTIGLGCAGGVIEGAVYEIGALCALDEAVEGIDLHALDMYVGVSSGGVIGAMLANGVSARELSRAVISDAHDPSLNLDPEVLFRPAVREWAGRLWKLPGAFVSSLRYYVSNPGDLSLLGLLSTFGSVLPTGLFTNAPLERFLEEAFSTGGRTNNFQRLKQQLYVVAMHLDTADVVVFGEPGADHVPISSAIQASTALPGLYTPVEIDGRYYIDGVARRTVHASVALDAGADLLFCINPIVPVNIQLEQHAGRLLSEEQEGPTLADRGLPSVFSQTFRAIVDSRKQTGFEKYAHTHPGADLILIEPECEDTSLFFSNIFSFKDRHDVCEHAYQATRRHLLRRADEIGPVLTRHGLTLRTDVLQDQSRSLYGDAPSDAPLPVAPENGTDDASSPTDVLQETDEVLDRLDAMLDRLRARAA